MDSTAKVAEIEQAEKEKMKEKVERILKHGINCFINRYVFCQQNWTVILDKLAASVNIKSTHLLKCQDFEILKKITPR